MYRKANGKLTATKGRQLLRCLGMGVLLAGLSSGAAADFYVGAGLGVTSYEDAEIFGIEEESTAFEAVIGVRPIDVLALEASFLNLGDIYDYEYDTNTNFSGVTMSGKAILPLGPQMDLFAKIGIFLWDYEEHYGGSRSYLIDDGQDLIFGGGAIFHLTEQLDLNLEYRELEMQDLEASLFTVGINFLF